MIEAEWPQLAEPRVTGMDNGQETTLLPFPGILGGSLTLRHLVMMVVIYQSRVYAMDRYEVCPRYPETRTAGLT